jgi:hypothetical protein
LKSLRPSLPGDTRIKSGYDGIKVNIPSRRPWDQAQV